MTCDRVMAIIPARGGSKGVPRKNLRIVAGRPLVGHSILNARQARTVSRVVVSTDSAEIGTVARQYGAEVIERPAEISGDTASSEAALLHALDHLEKTEGYEPDLLVFLQCTSPLTLPEDIDGTVQALLREDADSALSVAPFHQFVWGWGAEQNAVGINHDKHIRLRRQEREDQFLENGAVYAMKVPGFKQAKHRFFGKTVMYVMPRERCWEIDEPVDLDIVEVLLRQQAALTRAQLIPDPVAALVLDFDGVFTDNRVLVSEDGGEAVLCSRDDGLGLSQLKASGVRILVLSTEANPVVSARCRKLGLECLQGLQDKRTSLESWLSQQGVAAENVVYVGNDVNDLSCMALVGCSVAVSDAHPEVLKASRIVLSRPGGRGAIREICDLILKREEKRNG